MAAGYFDFTAGGVLSAANLEDYCEAQSIMRFVSTAARDAALVTIKTNGMFAYITGTSQLTVYIGSTWLVCDSQVTAWVAPTFLNSWVNFASGNQTARYRKIGDVVNVEGLIKTGTIGSAAFNLPAGFRPTGNLHFAQMSNGLLGYLIVNTTGDVTPTTGSNVYFALNCSFSTI